MVTISKKYDWKQCRYVIIVEWIERVDNANLRCDLMNLGGTQYTYISPTAFSFHTNKDFNESEHEKKANEIYRKYSAFRS